jgi:hypothetical protein
MYEDILHNNKVDLQILLLLHSYVLCILFLYFCFFAMFLNINSVEALYFQCYDFSISTYIYLLKFHMCFTQI